MPSRRPARVIFGKYEMGSLLGEGASAMVFRARHVTSGHTVAIKVFLKRWRLPGFSAPVDYFIREIFALRRLRHRHIICLHEAPEILSRQDYDGAKVDIWSCGHDRRLGGELTAFDMIVSSPGLDLSGLFLDTASRERFASVEPVDKIIDRVEQVGKADGLSVVREEGERRSGAVVEGQNGDVMLKVEVYRLTGDTSVVEVEMEASSGAVGRFWNEKLGPALMDRVGDH
ncbi:unnamed protein product [Musa textilis]